MSAPAACLATALVVVLAPIAEGGEGSAEHFAVADGRHYYSPRYRAMSTIDRVMQRARPANDAFPTEVSADELRPRLDELFRLIRGNRLALIATLLAPGFRGSPLPLGRPRRVPALPPGVPSRGRSR